MKIGPSSNENRLSKLRDTIRRVKVTPSRTTHKRCLRVWMMASATAVIETKAILVVTTMAATTVATMVATMAATTVVVMAVVMEAAMAVAVAVTDQSTQKLTQKDITDNR